MKNLSQKQRMPPRGHILVLSQQLGLRVLLRLFFTRAGYAIDIVTTRVEVKVILDYQKRIPDLVILDLYLDDKPSFEFASQLRALQPQLPILLIPPHDQSRVVSQDDLGTAEQLGVKILGKDVGIGGHSFYEAILELSGRS